MELYVLTADLIFVAMILLTTPGVLFYAANASAMMSAVIKMSNRRASDEDVH